MSKITFDANVGDIADHWYGDVFMDGVPKEILWRLKDLFRELDEDEKVTITIESKHDF